MRFPCIYKPAEAEGAPPTPEMMETMGKFIAQSSKEGFLLSTEGCLSSALGARVRGRATKVALTVDADDASFDALVEALQPGLLQLHGKETPARIVALKKRFGLPVMKAIAVESPANEQTRPRRGHRAPAIDRPRRRVR